VKVTNMLAKLDSLVKTLRRNNDSVKIFIAQIPLLASNGRQKNFAAILPPMPQ
jgi:hypothetical protein